MTAPPLADATARERIAGDLDTTFVVEAAAGTGKTTALVGRILALLQSGRGELQGIAAVTFTDKAAGEMKLRLRAEIDRLRTLPETSPEEQARLDTALAQLEVARIGTIHWFCADILRERPVEAEIDPGFAVIADDEASGLLERVFDRWFQQALDDPPEGIRRFLRRQPWSRDSGPRETLLAACAQLVEHRDHPAPWRRDPFDRAGAIDRVFGELQGAGRAGRARAQRARLPGQEPGPHRRSGGPGRGARGWRRPRHRPGRGRAGGAVARRRGRLAAQGQRPLLRRGHPARRRAAAARSGPRRPSTTSAPAPRPTWPRACTASWRRWSRPTRSRSRAAACSTSSTSWCARAICCAATPGSARPCSGASPTSSSTSSRTPIRCRPRSCSCWRPTIHGSTTRRRRGRWPASCSSSAIPSSRSTAFAGPRWPCTSASSSASASAAARSCT